MLRTELTFGSKESEVLLKALKAEKEGVLLGVLQKRKVSLFEMNDMGHDGLLSSGAVVKTWDLQGFSIFQNRFGTHLVPFSELNQRPPFHQNPYLSKNVAAEIAALIDAVKIAW